MPRGDKSKYTEKQQRQAEHIEEGYVTRGVSESEAERRAWATVNKMTGGGQRPGGSGRGKAVNKEPSKKGGRLGGKAAARHSPEQRSASTKKAAQTRKRNAARSK
jgi:plasmid stabilization system protein ParE